MEKLVNYRNWVKELLTSYATPPSNGQPDVEEQLIFDTEHDHYQLLAVGWENGRRVFFCILHLDIKNGKIWLQENSTDYDIVEDLIEKGVPKSDIVIGFHPADVRQLTEFAVA
ncbi:MAG: XisI protein [Saprospiraceae bacterium]